MNLNFEFEFECCLKIFSIINWLIKWFDETLYVAIVLESKIIFTTEYEFANKLEGGSK